MATNAAEPASAPRTHLPRTPTRSSPKPSPSSSSHSLSDPSSSRASSAYYASTSGNINRSSTGTSVSSRASLSSLRDSLPENPLIYDVSEISAATNNFLAKKHSSSSAAAAAWRCNLRGKDAVVFQRKFRRKLEMHQLKERLSVICRSHHMSVVNLLGASISGDHIFLVYDFVAGANLADCLRNSRNPGFTVLSSWISRMQIATDLAHGLDYIHNNTGQSTGFVHNHLTGTSVIVTEPSFNAKICHFGTAQLCGEADENEFVKSQISKIEIESKIEIAEGSISKDSQLKRSNSGSMQFEGVRGYMSPEFQSSGVATKKSDVYAFGVLILELLSGEEPLKYRFDREKRDFERTSVIDTARGAVEGGDDGVGGRLRNWVDRRLRDSFPVEVAEKVTRLALECVHVDPDKRPNMRRVAGKISKLYLESRIWSDNLKVPTGISVSLAPR